MTALDQVRRLFAHAAWADATTLDAVDAAAPPGEAVRELAHILGADEVWLARLEARAARAAVWPELSPAELRALADAVHAGYARYLARADEGELARVVAYTNSAGRSFETPAGDILLHVALHGHYHRGKINLLLRQARLAPAPSDFIAFVRGAPAAVRA